MRRLIERKRDGGSLEVDEWDALVGGFVAGTVDDAQMAAFAMAIVLRGIDLEETYALTHAMAHSGDVLELGFDAVDKHSSGGVGDAVSLLVVPWVAACGVPVAKLSGRGLGHTGGTLDKLAAIAGVRTDFEPHHFRAAIAEAGCAIAAQTARLVPADKKLYALRDHTGTVPSVGLIASSIVAKKIAGGASSIVYDVKVGRGAFMQDTPLALELARTLVAVTERFGRGAAALVTDMDEPLAPVVGDALELLEALDFLRGDRRDARLSAVAHAVAGAMLEAAGVPDGAARLQRALDDGSAYETFVRMIEAQGGSSAALEELAAHERRHEVLTPHGGYVAQIDAVAVGELVRSLIQRGGAGCGVMLDVRVGDRIERGERLGTVAGGDDADVEHLRAAFTIGEVQPSERPLLVDAITPSSLRSTSATR